MKKFCAIIIAIVFIFSFASVANAQITKDQYYARSTLNGNELKFYDYMYSVLSGGKKTMDYEKYGLREERAQQISQYVLNDSPELYNFYYDYTEEEKVKINKGLDLISDKVLSYINDDMNDVDKFEVVYAYLGEHIEYDYSVSKNRETTEDGQKAAECQTIIGGLINNNAVCTGMARSLQYILYQLDIPCYSVSGSNHMWNIVRLNGSWYITDLSQYEIMKSTLNYERILANEIYYEWANVEPDQDNPEMPLRFSTVHRWDYENPPTYEKPTPTPTPTPVAEPTSIAAIAEPTQESMPETAQKPEALSYIWYIIGAAVIAAVITTIVIRKKKA